MKFSDEMLMAYADGELDLVTRAEIESAMAADPELARAVERHRALAARLRAGYDGVLAEPVPERLAALVARPAAVPVADLAAKRAERPGARGRARLPQWAALAASVIVGVVVGVLLTRSPRPPYEDAGGALVARGALDAALSDQLAATSGESGVAIGITFRDRDGRFCRTFYMHRNAPVAGLACRGTQRWAIEVLAAAPPLQGELRPATAMPLPVLHVVDARMAGEPLDAAAEAAARNAGWRNPRSMAE